MSDYKKIIRYKPARTMVPVWVEAETKEKLVAICLRDGVSVSAQVRDMIECYIDCWEDETLFSEAERGQK